MFENVELSRSSGLVYLRRDTGDDYFMSKARIVTIARYSLAEALYTRLPWITVLILTLILAAAFFLQQLAITESARIYTAFAAAATRLAAVFLVCMHVISSVAREFDDKGLELILAFDLRRSDYILGRLLGFCTIAWITAVIACLPHAPFVSSLAALQWGLSLALELSVVAAVSLFCIVTFSKLIPAAAFVIGFYLLARTLSALRIMSDAPLFSTDPLAHLVTSLMISGLALLLPALDGYAQSSWLTDAATSWQTLGAQAVQTALYLGLLGTAAMFDFYRKNL